jgi:hypothetical protein
VSESVGTKAGLTASFFVEEFDKGYFDEATGLPNVDDLLEREIYLRLLSISFEHYLRGARP